MSAVFFPFLLFCSASSHVPWLSSVSSLISLRFWLMVGVWILHRMAFRRSAVQGLMSRSPRVFKLQYDVPQFYAVHALCCLQKTCDSRDHCSHMSGSPNPVRPFSLDGKVDSLTFGQQHRSAVCSEECVIRSHLLVCIVSHGRQQ